MTVTINLGDIFRGIFIFGWIIFATLIGVASAFTADSTEDRVFGAVVAILCLGSAATLYLGR